jgi:hypothetical protein
VGATGLVRGWARVRCQYPHLRGPLLPSVPRHFGALTEAASPQRRPGRARSQQRQRDRRAGRRGLAKGHPPMQIGARSYNGPLRWSTWSRIGAPTGWAPRVCRRSSPGVCRSSGRHAGGRTLGTGPGVIIPNPLRWRWPELLSGSSGDGVLFHAGWAAAGGSTTTPTLLASRAPDAVHRCLIDHQVAMTGCDSWSCGPTRREDPDDWFPYPRRSTPTMGGGPREPVPRVLAEAGVNQFLSSCPTPPGDATGAGVAPLAVI